MTRARVISAIVVVLSIAALVTIADQISKVIAMDELGPEAGRPTVSVIPGILDFRYIENTGAAFGMFQDRTSILIVVSIGVVALLAAVFWKLIVYSRVLAIAFGLQFGGAIGNLIDRIRLGFVVDFVDGPIFPVWNIADASITIGVTLLAVVLLFIPDWSDPEKAEQDSAQGDASTAILDRSDSASTNSPQESRS